MTLFERTLTYSTFILSALSMALLLSSVAQANTHHTEPTKAQYAAKVKSGVKECSAEVVGFYKEELEYLGTTDNTDEGIDSAVELESQYNCILN